MKPPSSPPNRLACHAKPGKPHGGLFVVGKNSPHSRYKIDLAVCFEWDIAGIVGDCNGLNLTSFRLQAIILKLQQKDIPHETVFSPSPLPPLPPSLYLSLAIATILA
ncbi:hypothetical protein M408DRAFT_241473 [Serendipita vermifera MAFF 305830]|uniref:Uncharacterized protein n=1 Tax=Serendipita vermifera MAFF 305830 TaxID=933852 RepID=A0A0C3BIL1_SERVB|nr:hypothetical protein M408DRAFT_241473 [Serendipita vermifera MAFF 305830]